MNNKQVADIEYDATDGILNLLAHKSLCIYTLTKLKELNRHSNEV